MDENQIIKFKESWRDEYQKLNSISKPTATRDIKILVDKKIFINIGKKGRGAIYQSKL